MTGRSPMTIKDELAAELRSALKAGDRPTAAAVRQIETEVALARSQPGFAGDVDDDLYRDVIASYVKKIRKARDEYLGYGERGAAHAEQLGAEIDFLSRWLPTKLDEEATRRLVDAAFAELGPEGATQPGRVIGHVMKSGRGDLDGSVVAALVRERFEAG